MQGLFLLTVPGVLLYELSHAVLCRVAGYDSWWGSAFLFTRGTVRRHSLPRKESVTTPV